MKKKQEKQRKEITFIMVDVNLVLEEVERALGALLKDKLILVAENRQLKHKVQELELKLEEQKIEGN